MGKGKMKEIMKLENNPKVSVIIPVFNSEKYIENALLSVLKQTYKNFEIIIIDDGSNDNTLDVIHEIKNRFNENRIIILEQNHRGCGAARNLGIRHAKADLIAFLDSDDIWFADKLERTIAVFNSRADVNLVSHDLIRVYSNGYKEMFFLHKRYNPKIDYFVNIYMSNCLVTSTVTLKKSVLLKNECFNEYLHPAEDYDFWLKISSRIKPYYIRKPLAYYLIREGSQSEDIDRGLQQIIKVLKRHFPELKKKNFFASLKLRKRMAQFLGAAGKEWLLRGNIFKAVALFNRALVQWPLNFKIFLYPLWVFYIRIKKVRI